jgi:hypothetical protein
VKRISPLKKSPISQSPSIRGSFPLKGVGVHLATKYQKNSKNQDAKCKNPPQSHQIRSPSVFLERNPQKRVSHLVSLFFGTKNGWFRPCLLEVKAV